MSTQLSHGCDKLRVGLTEQHGMVVEYSKFPPSGVEYSFLKPTALTNRIIKSPIKGYFRPYETKEHDLIETILSPVFTKNNWIYSLANFQEATAFNLLGLPLPRVIRIAYMKRLLLKDNFKKLIFWSQAGKETLRTYGGIQDSRILNKVEVVYPAIREVPDDLVKFNGQNLQVLFSGDFFRKGGVNVIDAFERAQRIYPTIKLRLCCDEKIDFNTQDATLKEEYLRKIRANAGILLGRVPRDELIRDILPGTDIYLLPTYAEAFGFAILEAMAYGIPVISTNHFAIPEMIEHGVSGFLIDTNRFDCEKLFKGYVVNKIPETFRNYVTEMLFKFLCQLIESAELRMKMGSNGVRVARSKFSIELRNNKMLEIYKCCL
ncbi:MAG: glycosyltransferase [Geobacter sp.]|nr:MAG: glycosyltransferase [Geobacter sp.]